MAGIAKLLIKEKPIYTDAMSAFPFSHELEEKMTIHGRFEKSLSLARKVGDKLLVPRGVAPVGAIDKRVVGLPHNFMKTLKFKPRDDEQARFVSESSELLLDGQSFVARAPTGKGKTAMSCPIIAAVGRYTLVVVPKTDLMNRWREDLIKILGLDATQIGQIQGDVCDVANKPVVLGMLQSLCKMDRYPAWVANQFGLVIYDEVHRLGAQEFVKSTRFSPAKLRLGLSATPTRQDGLDLAITAHIGPTRVKIENMTLKPKVLLIASGWKCPRGKDGKKIAHSGGKDAHVRRIMMNNPTRNETIIKLARAAYKKQRKLLIFLDWLDHINLITSQIPGDGVPASAISQYVGGMSEAALAKAAEAPIIVATYTMMNEGTNIPALDACILGMPKADVVQPVGRILRELEGKKQPIVMDIQDDESPIYFGYAMKRRAWYRLIGAEIIG
jgi:superfamily II DNA or RNA helicase